MEDLHLHGHRPHDEDDARNPTLNSYQKGFELRLNVSNFQLNCTASSILRVNGMSWTLELCNRAFGTSQNDSLIDITILPSVDASNAPFSWSCEANAIIELLSSDSINGSVIFNMPTREFTNNGPLEYGFSTGINWKNFTQYYVNGDGDVRINLNIASSPFRHIPHTVQSFAKFRVLLEDVSELGSDFSEDVRVRDIKWQVVSKRKHGSLGIYLYADEDDMDIDSAWQVKASFEILSLNGSNGTNRKNFTTIFHRRMSSWGFPIFISWTDLMNVRNNYVESNAAIVEVEIKVDEPTSIWRID